MSSFARFLPLDFKVPDLLPVEHRARLDRFQVQRAVLVPERLHLLRYTVLGTEVLGQPLDACDRVRGGAFAFQPVRNAVVGKLCAVADRCTVEIRAAKGPILAEDHFDDNGRAIFPVAKRREIGRQLLGEHGEDLGGGIDRGGVVPGVVVDRRALLDDGVHIRDRDKDLYRTLRHRLGDGELVQITGVVIVDRRPGEVTQVARSPGTAGRSRPDIVELGERRAGEVGQQSPFDHRPMSDPPQSGALQAGVRIHSVPLPWIMP